ncbi:MAG: serine/threonine protein kinase [Planctomycetota bacterium]|jgi:serine/threonine-protein kinase
MVDFSNIRVLVTDDDEAIRDTLGETLLDLGFQHVEMAANGEEALETLDRKETDLLLLDLAMPKIRGEEVVEVALDRDPDLIIIVITGFATLEKAVTLMKRGIYDLLRKPFNPHILAKKLESALLKHQAQKEGEEKPKDFGDFELIEEISRGGMGVIWRVREKATDEIVALKILIAGDQATDEQVLRFHREASTIAELRHPHIVSIRRIGVHKGQHYIAMDFIDGRPLDMWIEHKDPPLRTILHVLVQAGMALHYAHEREILHRDLKPSNILVDERMQPHIIDFGLAKSIRDNLRITEGRRLHGTIGYIAPERFGEKDRQLDARSDIYSLGVILYEILTGTYPYRLMRELDFLPDFSSTPSPPFHFRPELSRELSDAAMRAIALKPRDRFGSTREFMQVLRDCERGLL